MAKKQETKIFEFKLILLDRITYRMFLYFFRIIDMTLAYLYTYSTNHVPVPIPV